MNSILDQPGGGESGEQMPGSSPSANLPLFGAQQRPKRRGRLTLLLLLVLIPLSVYGWNYLTLQREMS